METRRIRKKDTGYRLTVSGLKGIMSIGLIILVIVLMIFLAKKTYQLGYDVFDMTSVDAKGEGKDVLVMIEEDMSVSEIGKLLNQEGLLNKGSLVFWIQERLSDYHGKILPGNYILNSSETVEQMLAILSQVNTEGQPQQNTNENANGQTNGGAP